ncbi:condensin complex subunit 2 [Osmia lignaria lignaria]|uniref:condensin complex subunit 2 n=1 Tax=Osmia lignaria lignaria TaxID=1437193 RepID=UPI00402B6403
MINMSESNVNSLSFTSSPLRRKSVLSRKSSGDFTLLENDDEAERLARRKNINYSPSVPSATSGRRSLGLSFLVHMPASQMAERISQCIKLGTENKINPKNAFSLEMIDFMTYMIKKQDANMSNLQVASTSLDVSTKIYGFRVDGVHMDILKLVGGLERQERDDKNHNNALEMDCQEEVTNNQAENLEKRKKMKKKHKPFSTVEALRTDIKTEKPSLAIMEADSQTTNVLYQVSLPNHANSRFYPHPYNDVLVDRIECKEIGDENSACTIPKITDLSQMEICFPIHYFNFHSWNADEELETVDLEKSNESRFEFDLDAGVPSDDECDSSSGNYFNTEECTEQNVNMCAIASKPVENIVDFCNVLSNAVSSSKTSEYSFVHSNLNIHWAGPSHWKLTNFKKISSNSNVIETCQQAPIKKRKEMELNYGDETFKSIKAKFLPSKSNKMIVNAVKTEWNEEILTLPPDKHYDIARANKLYLHLLTVKCPEINATCLSDDEDNYHHGNDNDVSMARSLVNNDKYQENRNFVTENENLTGTQVSFTGENLVAIPKLINKACIAYSTRAKRIDMKQLKKSIWTCLRSKRYETVKETEGEEEELTDKMQESKYFSEVYKIVPNLLTRTNIEALSFPISFVSLLHLANEKTLKITSSSDLKELIIEQD